MPSYVILQAMKTVTQIIAFRVNSSVSVNAALIATERECVCVCICQGLQYMCVEPSDTPPKWGHCPIFDRFTDTLNFPGVGLRDPM